MICRTCNGEKTAGQFYSRVASRCKDCHKAAMKIRRLTNPAVQQHDRERAKTFKRKNAARGITIRWRKKYPEAYRAHTIVRNAIRTGKLTKQPCAICGTKKKVHAHHQDYLKPLDVKWLCAKCHHRIHATFPQLGGNHASS